MKRDLVADSRRRGEPELGRGVPADQDLVAAVRGRELARGEELGQRLGRLGQRGERGQVDVGDVRRTATQRALDLQVAVRVLYVRQRGELGQGSGVEGHVLGGIAEAEAVVSNRDLVQLAADGEGVGEGVLDAGREGNDDGHRGDADRHARRAQRRAELAPPDAGRAHARRFQPGEPADVLLGLHGFFWHLLSARVFDDVAVSHPHDPVRDRGDLRVMGDHDDGSTETVHLLDEVEHALASLLVEVSGRLVGQDQPRSVGQGARDGYPLLLAAGKPGRPEVHSFFQPDLLQEAATSLAALRSRDAAEGHRQRHVVQRAHGRDQVEALEDGADVLQPVVGELAVSHLAQLAATRHDRSLGGPVKAADERQERRLAAT